MSLEEYKEKRYLEELQHWLLVNHPTILSEYETSNVYKELMRRLNDL